MKRFWDNLSVFVATLGFVGYIPAAPGTAASLIGFFLAFFIPVRSFFFVPIVLIASVFVVPFIYNAEKVFGREDDPRIVVDELAGCLLAAALLPEGWYYLAAAFVLFRFFDIFKPFIIRKSQNIPNGFGVIADDLLAGVVANITVHIGIYISSFFKI